ncbi:unnamed protein product [Rhizophagus irregularis]|nr:unnamed protein product [Rhizophagus irregularis]CAB5343437.1 unnamed protein product [Rhizophagus irregularis]
MIQKTFKTKGSDENLLWSKLHFKKVELEEVFALGIQITGTRWTIYSLSYDNSQNFYFFFEIKVAVINDYYILNYNPQQL